MSSCRNNYYTVLFLCVCALVSGIFFSVLFYVVHLVSSPFTVVKLSLVITDSNFVSSQYLFYKKKVLRISKALPR